MDPTVEMQKLRYPIGEFEVPNQGSSTERNTWINTISEFPVEIKEHTSQLSDIELSWRYRPEGWNIRQVVHHLADSHMNGLTRFKWTLTEDNPTIKPYFEDRWSKLSDNMNLDIESSIKILEGVHERWAHLMNTMTENEWNQTFQHPEYNFQYSLFQYAANYAWHCDHHFAHIEQALKFKGAFN